jgi:hypothetical protein
LTSTSIGPLPIFAWSWDCEGEPMLHRFLEPGGQRIVALDAEQCGSLAGKPAREHAAQRHDDRDKRLMSPCWF